MEFTICFVVGILLGLVVLFSYHIHCGIGSRAWMIVSTLGLHEVASNLTLNFISGSEWTLRQRLPHRPNRSVQRV